MMQSLISVIVPVYNAEPYIQDAIKSILEQQDSNIEIIIVDDGSTDGTVRRVEDIQSDIIRLYKIPKSGAPTARNFAIASSRGDYLLNVDADDILLPSSIDTYRRVSQTKPHIDVLYANLAIADDKLNRHSQTSYQNWEGRETELISSLFIKNELPNLGAFIKRKSFERVGPYRTEFTRAHDYEWWSRAAGTLKFALIDSVLSVWRWHSNNLSTTDHLTSEKREIDYSHEANVIFDMLQRYSLKQLFPAALWEQVPVLVVEIQCLQAVVQRLERWGDLERASIVKRKCDQMQRSIQSYLSGSPK